MLTDAELAKYPYLAADLEPANASEIRVGDLIAGAGPVGTGVFSGGLVTFTGWAGPDETFNCDTYFIEYRSAWGDLRTLHQPERITVWRVRADARPSSTTEQPERPVPVDRYRG